MEDRIAVDGVDTAAGGQDKYVRLELAVPVVEFQRGGLRLVVFGQGDAVQGNDHILDALTVRGNQDISQRLGASAVLGIGGVFDHGRVRNWRAFIKDLSL